MSPASVIGFVAAFAAFGTAAWVLVRWGQSFVSLTLIAGLVLAGLEAGFSGIAGLSESARELLHWRYLGVLVATLQPGVWLLFVFSFPRAGTKMSARRKWFLASVFVLPLVSAVLFDGDLFGTAVIADSGWTVSLAWGGRVFHLFLLLSAVAILMQLERTFRASAGAVRWQVKFLILGVGILWAVRIYASSQSLLLSSSSSELDTISPIFLMFACASIGLSLKRTEAVTRDLYLSQSLVHNSLVALAIGIYLITVGLLAKLMSYFGQVGTVPIESFVLFVALIGLTVLLLSDQVRQRTKKLIARHLGRPQFDYRKVWADFTGETSAVFEEGQLAASVARLLARTFGVSSSGIWSWDERNHTLELIAGTFHAQHPVWRIAPEVAMRQLVMAKPGPCDLRTGEEWARALKNGCPQELLPAYVTHAIPLMLNDTLFGFVTMNDKLTGESFSSEELELFRTLSEQTAATLLNIRMSKDLRAAREAEAFQRIAAFLVHDLKNLAGNLSLTVNNLPRHFDNPEFRADALKSIKRSVDKMNAMCGRLGSLKTGLALQPEERDLNSLVESSLSELNGIRARVRIQLHEVGTVFVDAGAMTKVLHNLIFNAVDASGKECHIDVATEERAGAAVLCVRDNGCGMSRDFIDTKLFRPFTSTKEKGLGIGLFQSKQIIEALNGRIDVESEEGKGTTIRVSLPVAREPKSHQHAT